MKPPMVAPHGLQCIGSSVVQCVAGLDVQRHCSAQLGIRDQRWHERRGVVHSCPPDESGVFRIYNVTIVSWFVVSRSCAT